MRSYFIILAVVLQLSLIYGKGHNVNKGKDEKHGEPSKPGITKSINQVKKKLTHSKQSSEQSKDMESSTDLDENETMSDDSLEGPGKLNELQAKYPNMPPMPIGWKERFKKPYHPAWMDPCDPWHCNDYHKVACGLNRKTMRFKWFQSGCHIKLNNKCQHYRGSLKYDWVDTKFCHIYVMFLRQGCNGPCESDGRPVCGVSLLDNHVTLFKDQCALNAANCRSVTVHEYQEVDPKLCNYYLEENEP